MAEQRKKDVGTGIWSTVLVKLRLGTRLRSTKNKSWSNFQSGLIPVDLKIVTLNYINNAAIAKRNETRDRVFYFMNVISSVFYDTSASYFERLGGNHCWCVMTGKTDLLPLISHNNEKNLAHLSTIQ